MATKNLIKAARKLSFQFKKPVALSLIADSNEWFMMKNTADFPIFTEPDDALKALAFSLAHYRNKYDSDLH